MQFLKGSVGSSPTLGTISHCEHGFMVRFLFDIAPCPVVFSKSVTQDIVWSSPISSTGQMHHSYKVKVLGSSPRWGTEKFIAA